MSLNDVLPDSPNNLRDVPTVLTDFRDGEVAFCGDIRQMYRQIQLDPKDRNYHRFYWRPDPTGPIMEFRLTTATFRIKSLSYLSNSVVQDNMEQHQVEKPAVHRLVKRNMFSDNLCGCAKNAHQAIQLITDTNWVFSQASLPMVKWFSNRHEVNAAIPPRLVGTGDVAEEGAADGEEGTSQGDQGASEATEVFLDE